MKVVSADDHLLEPPDLWRSRLPARYAEAAPHVVADELGDAWVYEGRRHRIERVLAIAGRPEAEYDLSPLRFSEMRPGCSDPVARLADMDADGIHAQLCFPTFPRFAGTRFLEGGDPVLAGLCVRAWNEFVLDEWWAAAPDRFIPMVIVPLWDVELAAAEAAWAVERGARAVSFPENTVHLGLPSIHGGYWDPLFAVLDEASTPLCLHFGTSGVVPTTGPDAPHIVGSMLYGTSTMSAMVDFLMSPVFHAFPALRIALSEGGIGWIPYLLEKMDHMWRRHRHYQLEINQDVSPRELFQGHVFGCFIEDEHGVRNLDAIGTGQVLFESDYPHSDSNWPDSRNRLAALLAEVPDDDAHRVAELNARELFRFP
ncbi:MAG: amidohydrolase family protein [Acidimicrobiia bacterium]